MNSYGKVAFCLAVFLLVAVLVVPVCFAVDSEEAINAISQAEMDLGSAYTSIVEAEGAGADVSVLLSKLNTAGVFLSEAYSEYRSADYENAGSLALECIHAVDGISDDAVRLKADSERARSDVLTLSAALSGVGLVLLLVFGFLGWRFLKRWYFRQVLKKKPQVEGTW